MEKEEDSQSQKWYENQKYRENFLRVTKFVSLAALILSLIIIFITQSEALFLVTIILNIFVVIYFIVKVYTHEQFTSLLNKIVLFIVYLCAFAVLAIVPLDISEINLYAAQGYNQDNINNYKIHSDRFFNTYQGIYITSTLFTALLITLLKIANLNGYLSFKKIFINTLKTFLKQMIILLIVGIVLLVAVQYFFKVKGNLILSVLILISNTIGIIWLVGLLGVGLLQFPVHFFEKQFVEYNIDNLLKKSDELFKKQRTLQMELKSQIKDFKKLIEKIPQHDDNYIYVEYMKEELPSYQSILGTAGQELQFEQQTKTSYSNVKEINEDVIAEARSNLKQTKEELMRSINEWNENYQSVKNESDMNLIDQVITNNTYLRKNRRILPRIISKPQQIKYILYGFVTLIFSIVILVQELLLAFGGGANVLMFSKIKESIGGKQSFQFLFIFIILLTQGYIILSTYFALFNLTFSKDYKLSTKNTSPNTILSNAAMCFSLSFPLCYNTLMIFDETKHKSTNNSFLTGFANFYNPVTSMPIIGTYYNYIVPLFIIFFSGGYIFIKIRTFLKEKKREQNEEFNKEQKQIQDGETIIINEYKKELRQIRAQQLQNQKNNSDDTQNDISGYEIQLQQQLIKQNNQNQQNQVKIKYGYLVDQSNQKRQFYQIEKNIFKGFKDNESLKPIFTLPLKDIKDVTEQGLNIIIIDKQEKKFNFKAEKQEDVNEWVNFLQYKLVELELQI